MGELKLERTSGGLLPNVLRKEGQLSDQTRLFRETAPPLWETYSPASLFSWWKKSFSLYPNQHVLCVDLYPLLLISPLKSLDPGSICSVTSTWVQEGCVPEVTSVVTKALASTQIQFQWRTGKGNGWRKESGKQQEFPVGCGNPLSGEIALHREDVSACVAPGPSDLSQEVERRKPGTRNVLL